MYNGKYGVITDRNGLYYMRARYYNTDIRRFINQDILTGTIADSQSLNRYAYCQGNPVSLSDPFGLNPFMAVNFLGHAILDSLGFIPVLGVAPDIVNAIWYFMEGNQTEGWLCMLSALPLAGDVVGISASCLTNCDRFEKILHFSTRAISNGANFVLGTGQAGTAIIGLYNKHIVNNEAWDWESTLQLAGAALFAGNAVYAGKNLFDDLGGLGSSLSDIKSAQCFVEGTLVVTREGMIPIEEIEPGDYVLSYNEETGETDYREVVRLFRNTTKELAHVEVSVTGESDNPEEILCTPGHRFYVEGEWIPAEELQSGDHLTLADGTSAEVLTVTLEELEDPTVIYNFEVEEWHNYYVSDSGVLVHNMGCGTTGNKSGKNSDNYVYRALNQKDYERYTNGLGLEAKNPNGSWSLKEHLVDGSGKLSWANDPYISTTSDLSVAKGFNQSGSGYGIVKIDMNKVTSPSYKGYEIYPRVNGKEGLPYHYSVWQQETSVYQSIPFEAIVDYFN